MEVVQNRQGRDVTGDDSLQVVYRRLVNVHYGLAESLRSDTEIVPWAMRELREVLDYIQAVKKSGAAAVPD